MKELENLNKKSNSKYYENIRNIAFNEGRKEAENSSSSLFIKICMLYWAEGHKNKNTIRFTNSNSEMFTLFIKGIIEIYKCDIDSLVIEINAYSNNNIDEDSIRSYWNNILSPCYVSKVRFDADKRNKSGKRSNKYVYGIATVFIHSTVLAQKMQGAIDFFKTK